MRFEGRAVIITGGAKGIGRGCTDVFFREGASVGVLDLDVEAGEQMVRKLAETGPGKILFARCDVGDHEQLRNCIDELAGEFGRLDCIVNNAGIHPPATSLDDTSIELVERVMRINFLSTFAGAKYAVPHLRKTRGSIVNISSMTAVLGQDQSSAYAASKGAQLSLTKALAVELGREGIRVNAILPSNIDTPLMHEWAATLDDPESALKRVAELQVFGRMGTPEEIGRIALFLASEEASFLTGQGIEAEGGASLDY